MKAKKRKSFYMQTRPGEKKEGKHALAVRSLRQCAAEGAGVRTMQGRHLLFQGLPGVPSTCARAVCSVQARKHANASLTLSCTFPLSLPDQGVEG
jgi:hypothetical protein